MLNQQTIDKLHAMKLHGFADAFRAQLETTEASQLSFEERFALRGITIGRGDREYPWEAARPNGFRDEPRVIDRQLDGVWLRAHLRSSRH